MKILNDIDQYQGNVEFLKILVNIYNLSLSNTILINFVNSRI